MPPKGFIYSAIQPVVDGYFADAILTSNSVSVPPITPIVTLTTTTPSIALGGGVAGELTFSLSAVQTNDLIIDYTIKGTAINGIDYVMLKDSKKIKAGKSSKSISIIPEGNLGGASKKTVIFTLIPADGYAVGANNKIKVKIAQ